MIDPYDRRPRRINGKYCAVVQTAAIVLFMIFVIGAQSNKYWGSAAGLSLILQAAVLQSLFLDAVYIHRQTKETETDD